MEYTFNTFVNKCIEKNVYVISPVFNRRVKHRYSKSVLCYVSLATYNLRRMINRINSCLQKATLLTVYTAIALTLRFNSQSALCLRFS